MNHTLQLFDVLKQISLAGTSHKRWDIVFSRVCTAGFITVIAIFIGGKRVDLLQGWYPNALCTMTVFQLPVAFYITHMLTLAERTCRPPVELVVIPTDIASCQ